jgi:hypothetical protein
MKLSIVTILFFGGQVLSCLDQAVAWTTASVRPCRTMLSITSQAKSTTLLSSSINSDNNRRDFINNLVIGSVSTIVLPVLQPIQPANAIGPVKITLQPKSYQAQLCPPNKPIPGQKAMVGMRGMCVTVVADLLEKSPKELEKVGVYGFVTDGITGDSVLANNPDLSTDAGQFAMIESIKTTDTTIEFEFIAAVPMEKDISQYSNGIGPLKFDGLRIISYPGGQQFGEINPCEMNEFSPECEDWENINGPYQKQEYMVKSKKVR